MSVDADKRSRKNILVTGGSGFIGTNFIRYLLESDTESETESNERFSGKIVNLDLLTYAGNPDNLVDVAKRSNDRYQFIHGDIGNAELLVTLFEKFEIDTVVNFAAESHVDRSIHGPSAFIQTNLLGTFTLLEAARSVWQGRDDVLFHHVSTDEVFGSLGEHGLFTEQTAYDPRSPYSATKAGSDHLVRAYHHTYGLPVTLTNCSNNYGPYQFPEKLIPLMVFNMVEKKPLPVYGDGKNIRDWLFVGDHVRAVWRVVTSGKTGESYNIGGENEWENIRLVKTLCDIAAAQTGVDPREYHRLITFVDDRPGHDRRYAIDCSKIKNELHWNGTVDFEAGLQQTVRWYLDNPAWVRNVRSGAYREWVHTHYEKNQ